MGAISPRLPLTTAILFSLLLQTHARTPRPHIFAVVVDDFGWGDAGFHRAQPTPEVVTPNMEQLVQEGILLNRHYVHMACTPSRSAFQSGRLPVHVQLTLAGPCCREAGIPRNMTTIAHKLTSAGYAAHFVGKWDAGMATPTQTPQGRGYNSSLNYFGHGNWVWTQAEWAGSENNRSDVPKPGRIDFWDTDQPANTLNGTGFEEDLFFERIRSIIAAHNSSEPLFLAYGARMVHYPLQAPIEYQQRFSFIDEPHRRMYAAMVAFLDMQLGRVRGLLEQEGLWSDTLMILTSDNGGYVEEVQFCNSTTPHGTECFNGESGANNYPLRGGKYYPFEGGIRSNAFVSGGFLPPAVRGSQIDGVMHIADWYATFCALAGVDPTDKEAAAAGLPPIDSLNMWPMLSGTNATSPRREVHVRGDCLVQGDYKLITGKVAGAGWSGPQYPNTTSAGREVRTVELDCRGGCLFNIADDPTEHVDLAASHPHLVQAMLARLAALNATIFHRVMPPDDPACNATAYGRYGGFLGPWLEL